MAKRQKNKSSKFSVVITTVIVILLVGLLLSKLNSQASLKKASVGKEAPNFTLVSLEGKKVSLDDFKGRPVILNFWATWCPPCKLEMPALNNVYKTSTEKGFVVLTVNQQEDAGTIQKFFRENGYSLPVVLDSNGQVGEMYQVSGIPTTVFIDSKGVITDIHTGSMPVEALFLDKLKY